VLADWRGEIFVCSTISKKKKGRIVGVCVCTIETNRGKRVGYRELEREKAKHGRVWTMSCASSSPVGFVASHFAAVAQNSSSPHPVVVASPMKSADDGTTPSPAPRSSSSYMLVI
jgi:hypothetical protein